MCMEVALVMTKVVNDMTDDELRKTKMTLMTELFYLTYSSRITESDKKQAADVCAVLNSVNKEIVRRRRLLGQTLINR